MEILCKYPDLSNELEKLCKTRRNEILSHMLESDKVYNRLCRERSEASMSLKNLLSSEEGFFLEKYADTLYAQELYELDSMYRQGFLDALSVLLEKGIL